MRRAIGWVVVAALASTTLGGCVLLVGGAAAGGAAAVVATDRRSVGIQLEDHRIESKVNDALDDAIPSGAMRIDVLSYDRKVLLSGQVRTADQRALAGQVAAQVENVSSVANEITVGNLDSLGDRADDTLIAGKVKTALLGADGVPTGVVETNVNSGVVYLLGKVTPSEGDAAAKAVSRVSGVRRVVKLFELITDQEAEAIKRNQQQAAKTDSKADSHP